MGEGSFLLKRKQRRFLALSWFLCSLLLISMIFPPISYAKADPKASTSLLENYDLKSKTSKDKISPKLIDQFKQNKNVTFLIKFKQQADTKNVAAETAKKAKAQKQTSAKAELMKRSAVVSSLRATATETQHKVKQYLNEQKKKGLVKEIQSFYIVNAIAVTGTEEVMNKLAIFPEVDKILPNETRQLIGIEHKKLAEKSSKSSVNQKTNAKTTSIEWNIEQVGAPQVWKMGIDGSGTVVANIDTGVQWDHPALKTKYRGYNPAQPDQPNHLFNWFDAVNGQAAPYDDLEHGTHTMGTMVGSEPGGANQIGVAPGAKWIAVKAFSENGGTDIDLLQAGEWILAPKDAQGNPHPEQAPDVVNNSWGGGPGMDEWYRPMVQNWRAAEIFPEFSAGNTTLTNPGGPGSVATPANYPESFATGATDINNRLASFSLQGPSPYEEIKPEVSAPGVNIRSSVPGGTYQGGWNGTSMAGPHVAATVALLRQANASLTVEQIEEILLDTAIPLTDSNFPESPNNGYGHGLVNAFNAVSSILNGLGQVHGQVVREGEDNEPPVYQHTPQSETYLGFELPLTISVQDNVSIRKAELQYRSDENTEWQTVEAKRTAGDYRNGTFQAIIPSDAIKEPKITYHWRITDYGQNSVTSDHYEIPVKSGATIGYRQDFETAPVGWYSYGFQNSWEWGVPTSGPSSAASGEKVYATNLDGNYNNGADMTLVMPPFELPQGNAYLHFKHWYELEQNYDYGHVLVSTDRENWVQLARYNHVSGGWINGEVDLSQYAGQRIYIAFHVRADNSIEKQGWYLDDVTLSAIPFNPAAKAQPDLLKQKVLGAKANQPAKNKQPVHPEKMKPSKLQNILAPTAITVKNQSAQPASLPLGARVSVLETGQSVSTNPADGSYSITHPVGEYTLRAETYGYRSVDQSVNIPADGTTEANFTLHPIPKGTVSGTVTNKQTGQPVAGATLLLMEDAAIQPIQTDENGHFSITAYEGTYTLHVTAPHYYSQDVNITIPGNGNIEQNVLLKPFIGHPGEIGYDDGTPEDARAYTEAGNGWAVKMSLPQGQKHAVVTAALFRFWDTSWPDPGGTNFRVAVYDASGPDGAPGKKLAGPFEATALRNGEWTVVDLAEKGIFVNGDFYMVYLQTTPYPHSPGLGADLSGEYAGRSWRLAGGAWSPTPRDYGNFMIRARVNYEVTPPVITSPRDESHINQSTITVEGKAAPTTQVHIFNKGNEVAAVPARDDGTFSAEITLQNGENILTATASKENGTTEPSEPVKVILDQTKPVLTIESPTDGFKTNREAITITGKATDEHLAGVKVNGQPATVGEDGTYTLRLLLNNGENKFTVKAADLAGNETSNQVSVYAKIEAPPIENLKPDQDVRLKTGQTVKIELDSEPGLKGSFVIHMPLTDLPKISPANATELPLMEQGEGHYVGYWTATKGKINGARIEVILKDDYGNVSRKIAAGKLYVNVRPK
ncbi:S8 family serine peptidase [Paenactinomyces guangxiensis]|uniref:S8 family serine peptidase n=1 Tax=Paenactinomyces guangxiensis TaxID=1490290 RepID=A0A7W1WRX4_9BACL|nr:S8 family serine peptidase [Paenactinomyces guangxiensis]MBA4494940.1 S8 family serine peptidase [Paenactinomyces guangxiensis]MBH8592023.1 S8 family serine peptidase [Paenactinomyces guangxiensis]